jgi:ubiquitin-hydrolase Zn-finger-containing protein
MTGPKEHAMSQSCNHLDQVTDVTPSSDGCEDCLRIGGRWVHVRMCMSPGHVGCYDNSPSRPATAHFNTQRHPIIQSYEPRKDWWYCYVDDLAFAVEDAQSLAHP